MKLKEPDQIPRVKSNTDLGRWLERGWKGLSDFLVYFELRINIWKWNNDGNNDPRSWINNLVVEKEPEKISGLKYESFHIPFMSFPP